MSKSTNQHNSKQSPIRRGNLSRKTLVKKSGTLPAKARKGTVTGVVGTNYFVRPDNNAGEMNDELIKCMIAGVLITPYIDSSLVAVGDEVDFQIEEYIDSDTKLREGTILRVRARGPKLSRRAAVKKYSEHVIASNADQLLIFTSFQTPDYNKKLIDRMCIAAVIGGLKPIIAINKIDLCSDMEFLEEDFSVYDSLGIETYFVSVLENEGIDALVEALTYKRTVFAGQSGAGKSSLVNKLLGSKEQTIKEVSERTRKGQHTTSFVRMFDLPSGGEIIDSPGIREFGIWGISKGELALYFDDFDEYSEKCRYQPCSHIHEPGCAVTQAVESGEIDVERYVSYVNIYETIEEKPL